VRSGFVGEILWFRYVSSGGEEEEEEVVSTVC
jgi:hypothetical protein